MIKNSNSQDFAKDVLMSQGKVLVDFWAEWCGPCKAMLPILEEISEYMDVYKINTDECSGLSAEMSIRSVPTIIVFKDGKEVNRIIGARPRAVLLKEIELEK